MRRIRTQEALCLVDVFSPRIFICSTIYVNLRFENRKLLLDALFDFVVNVNIPRLAIGDFNIVTHVMIKKTQLYMNIMGACNFIDLGYSGQKFTWTNIRRHNSISEHLPRITSDRCLILSLQDPEVLNKDRKPFTRTMTCCLKLA